MIEETRNFWESLRGSYQYHDCGFSVFYSPVRRNPDLMLVGFNPGGAASDFHLPRAMSVPKVHDYFSPEWDYSLASEMRQLFRQAGKIRELRDSVKTNTRFFRCPSRAWDAIPSQVRQEMGQFCDPRLVGMRAELEPRIVVTEGLEAFEIVRRLMWPASEPHALLRQGPARACVRAVDERGRKLLGLIHLTGARVSAETKCHLADILTSELA
ncbi:MAG: hypothetical protein ACR2HN_05330 [Tepidiformaceae bacterium]